MPRPEYPSDEKRRKNKPAVRVHHSIETHPKMEAIYPDNDALATWLRIMLAASRAHAGKTGDSVTFAKNAAGTMAGRSCVARALPLLRHVCAELSWPLRETRTSVTIHVRNFAKKQGHDSADRGDEAELYSATPHPSVSVSESESEFLNRTVSSPLNSGGNGNGFQHPLTREEKATVGPLVEDMVALTGDHQERSAHYFVRAARTLGETIVRRLMSETREGMHEGKVDDAAKLFTWKLDRELKRLRAVS